MWYKQGEALFGYEAASDTGCFFSNAMNTQNILEIQHKTLIFHLTGDSKSVLLDFATDHNDMEPY